MWFWTPNLLFFNKNLVSNLGKICREYRWSNPPKNVDICRYSRHRYSRLRSLIGTILSRKSVMRYLKISKSNPAVSRLDVNEQPLNEFYLFLLTYPGENTSQQPRKPYKAPFHEAAQNPWLTHTLDMAMSEKSEGPGVSNYTRGPFLSVLCPSQLYSIWKNFSCSAKSVHWKHI